jgi:hypothetical protein
MTYQTSPNFKWVFPDEAIARNVHGIGKLKAVRIPSQKIWGEHNAVHENWRQQAHDEALSRVRNTKRANEGMLGKLKMNERSQRYYRDASRSAVENGKFPSGEYVTSGGLRGGVITTKEGREWLAKRLNNRIVEYDAIASRNFSAGPPPTVAVEPAAFDFLNASLQTVFDSFASAKFTGSIIDEMIKLQSEFLKVGALIEPSQLDLYSVAFQKLTEAIRPYTGIEETGLYGDPRDADAYSRNLDYIRRALKNLNYFLREVARSINWTLPERQQLMESLRAKKLADTVQGFVPTFSTEENLAGIQAARPIEQGQQPQPIPPPNPILAPRPPAAPPAAPAPAPAAPIPASAPAPAPRPAVGGAKYKVSF